MRAEDRAAVEQLLAAAPPVPPRSAENISTAIGSRIRDAYERLAASPDRAPAA